MFSMLHRLLRGTDTGAAAFSECPSNIGFFPISLFYFLVQEIDCTLASYVIKLSFLSHEPVTSNNNTPEFYIFALGPDPNK